MSDLNEYRKTVRRKIAQQRAFFVQGRSRELNFRVDRLKRLKEAIVNAEKSILNALHCDLGKSHEESYLTEIGMVINELTFHIRNLKKWAKPHKVNTPLFLFPSKSYTVYEPFGITLILSPWNYPFQLLINPLIAAVSAGNCAILKPSPHTPNINQVTAEIIEKVFDPQHICLIEGNNEETLCLLEEPFDLIFFTGSSSFGKIVIKAASEHLTPVILELGGKSPCIVDQGCNIELTAKRIVWGKLLNAGQTCVAPDYIWVHHSLEQKLINALKKHIVSFYGEHPLSSSFYPKIINAIALSRLKSYLNDGEIAFGGEINEENLSISPTLLRNVQPGSSVMQDEIFGPILPILPFQQLEDAIKEINNRPKPLALYYFGKQKNGDKVIRNTSSGGACINDTILHLTNHHLPFGGVGASGMGRYHGKYSYQTFSHERSILYSSTKIDFPLKYVPFRFFSLLKRLL